MNTIHTILQEKRCEFRFHCFSTRHCIYYILYYSPLRCCLFVDLTQTTGLTSAQPNVDYDLRMNCGCKVYKSYACAGQTVIFLTIEFLFTISY